VKAVLYDQPGDPDVLYYGDAPDPIPGADELLVRVRAAGVNRADLLQRQGRYPPPPGASPILGLELAGEVEAAAGSWRVGDLVMAVVSGGAYAQRAVVPSRVAMRIPDGLSFEQAAAIPEAFLTAYLNLFTLGGLTASETVLIHAGASGVGTAAVQLVKAAGARAIVTAGTDEKCAFCRALGADLAINYKTDSFAERVHAFTDGAGVDLVLDFIGAPYWSANTACLRRGGRLLLIGFLGGASGDVSLSAIMTKNLTVTGTTLRATPLDQKARLVSEFEAFARARFLSGELRPVIDRVYALRDAAEAHRRMAENANLGKLILRVE
jgi:putative PIG3 family NAD(P)H quinone oxidoreductase